MPPLCGSAVRAHLESGTAPELQEKKPPALPDKILSGDEELLDDDRENQGTSGSFQSLLMSPTDSVT